MIRSRRAGVALILVALNLRIAIAAIPPVLEPIRHDTGLSSAGGGLLTAVPVFCFGIAALGAPRLIRWLRMGPLLALTMVAVAAGSAVRLVPSVPALFLGTAVIGIGIAVGNGLLPSLIKRDFPHRLVAMTSLYSVSLCLSAAISAGLTVPLEHLTGAGWRLVVALWGIPALVALVVWGSQVRREGPAATSTEAPAMRALWRDPLAWAVTLFMGLQSFGYYSVLSWVPTILQDHGLSSAAAGGALSYSMFPSMLTALITPGVERRTGRPITLIAASAALCAGGYVGLLLAPASAPYAWMTLVGLGQGAALSLALGFIVKRAPDSRHAAQLSTMAQSVGYLVASSGPFLLGALHGLTASWTLPLVTLLIALVPLLLAGIGASRDRHVLESYPRVEPEVMPAGQHG